MANGFHFNLQSLSPESVSGNSARISELAGSRPGILLLLVLALLSAYAVSSGGITIGVVIVAGTVGLPVLFGAMFNLNFGVILIIILSFLVLGVKRLSDGIPLGLGMDIIMASMLLGLLIKQTKERNWEFARNPITKAILFWIVYNLAEVGNPTAESRLAWMYTIRGTAGFMVLYFILMYVINSRKTVYTLLTIWIIMATAGALYGFYQEYVGFLPFEQNWIMSDIRRYRLLFIWGHFRKFSFFSDPMVFGFVMAYTALMCFVLAQGTTNRFRKIVLQSLVVIMIMAMIYSGTRAAYAVLPAGLFFYSVLSFKKQIIMLTGVLFFVGLIVVNIPTSNTNLVRFQSAFKPNEDDSYKVRKKNQAFIQPYILKHPLGGGLGSTGVWGERFSPNSPIAKFPPDSGFMRIAVEMGWLGLLFYCSFLYTIFHIGIKDYLTLKDKRLKTIALAMLVVIYTLVVGNFPQEAINQYPTSILFFTAIAIVNRLKHIEQGELSNG